MFMRYASKRVKLPSDMSVGSEIGIVGEGWDDFKVTEIVHGPDGVVDVLNSSGWREPLCNIYLLRGRSHSEAMSDPTSWIDVAVGECDDCGKTFADRCVYRADEAVPQSMVCMDCAKVRDGLLPGLRVMT